NSVWRFYDGGTAYFSDDVRMYDNSTWLVDAGACYALDDDHELYGTNTNVCGQGGVSFGNGGGGGATGTSNFWEFNNGADTTQVCNTLAVYSGPNGGACPEPGDSIFTGTGVPATLGDTIWLDLDGDGVFDSNEVPVEGVTVDIYNASGALIARFVTGPDGGYNSGPLPPGDYTVTITPPAGYTATYDEDSGTASPDNTTDVTLAPGDNHLTADFGLQGDASIGDYVWEDSNGDGVQDGSESGIEGVIVNLTDANGNIIATDTTDANGAYLFENLPPGDYTVTTTPPAGYDPTYDENSGTTSPDNTTDVTIGIGDEHLTADFGYQGTASLGDTIYEDTDGDGSQGADEPGIEGVVVTLTDADGNVVGTDTTDANGNYGFDNLPPGDYTVTVTPPAGYDNTGDPNGGLDNTSEVTLAAGENNPDQDFGYQGNASLGDTIYEDTDGDGSQGADEPGIEGVVVTLTDADGNVVGT
ncbi:MAG: SdrD B-like domain-containing protein, partial [Bacteroidota bacterium]